MNVSRPVGLVLVGVLASCCAAGAPEARPYKSDAGPHEVATVAYDWVDAARERQVPVRIYFPKEGDAPLPVIVFSHGLGGTREGYVYLGRHWASHGYVSVHLQHKGSDDAVWRGKADPLTAMRESLSRLQAAIDRPRDVRFAVDQLEKANRETPPLKGRLDLARLGMAGHSYGAWTTLAIAGQGVAIGAPRLADPRFKAAIPMSAPPARPGQRRGAYAGIRIPCYHMTGTLDDSLVVGTKANERRIPFDLTGGADQYLVTFEGGDHMVFSGRRWGGGDAPKDPVFHDLIRQSTTAFWDAYLKRDAAALEWLRDGGFAAVLGANGVFEKKILTAEKAVPGTAAKAPAPVSGK